MIFEALAYPLGKILGAGLSAFETWQKKQEVILGEKVRDNEHRREIELMEKQALIHRELEAIKTEGQVQISKESTNQEEMKHLAAIALSDNRVKQTIIHHTPDWGTHAMTAVRVLLGISSGIVFFYVGILSTDLLLTMIKAQIPNISSELLKTFIDSYETFFHSTVSLVLTYVGVTHANRQLGRSIK